MEISLRPIAFVRNDRAEALDDRWDEIESTIELSPDVPSEALTGLGEFSHIEVIFFADWAEDVPPGPWHRRPQLNPDWPDVGIFAQRNKDRPNRLLLSTVAITSLNERSITVRGLDAIDGSPVLDIKPLFRPIAVADDVRVAPWSEELQRTLHSAE